MFFQMTFAIITPALIAGALADRMKYSAFLLFMGAWLLLVYCPIAHWVWGGGWLGKAGALDFAGGTVVHLNAGTAGLVAALMLGKRKGLGTENFAPHNLAYSVIGASLLWVGWFGFNAGSAVEAHDGQAGMAAAATQIATAAAGPGLDGHGVDHRQEAFGPGHGLRRRRRPGGHHPGLGLRQSRPAP